MYDVPSQCRALLCQNCQYAVVPAQLKKHLRAHHKRLTIQQDRDIISRVEELSGTPRMPSDVVSAKRPTNPRFSESFGIAKLNLILTGFET